VTGFTVSPETFAPVSAQLRQAADQLQSAWSPVRGASQSVHYGSGTDMVSPLIQTSLNAAVQLVDSCVSTSMRALHGFADGLDSMSRTYSGTEQGNTEMFHAS
jgi:hypothetical protein